MFAQALVLSLAATVFVYDRFKFWCREKLWGTSDETRPRCMTVVFGASGSPRRTPWRASLAVVLDAFILVQFLALLAVLLLGGVDWKWVSATRAAKPLLMLLLSGALRLAIPDSTPYLQPLGARPWYRSLTSARERVHLPSAITDVLFAILVTCPAALAVAFLSHLLFPPRQFSVVATPFRTEKFMEIFAVWDSGWYFDIARRGYYFNPDGQSSIAFFPLYPLLMRLVATPFGGSDRAIWIAGMALSGTAFVAALVALHRFTERVVGGQEAASRTVLYVAVFPFSFFFLRVYTESLFLLLTVLAIASAYDGRWWRAGITGALAALTRPNGILVAVPLLCFALARGPNAQALVRRLAAVTLVPLALGLYCWYLYTLTGSPLAWLEAQRHWQYSIGDLPWRQLLKLISTIERHGPYDFFFTSTLAPYELVHGAVALLFLLLTPAVFARLGVALGAYTLVSLVVPLTGSDLQGLGRYSAVLFPVFMLLGSLQSSRVHQGILVISALFLALFLSLFVNWYPIF